MRDFISQDSMRSPVCTQSLRSTFLPEKLPGFFNNWTGEGHKMAKEPIDQNGFKDNQLRSVNLDSDSI